MQDEIRLKYKVIDYIGFFWI